MRERRLGCGWRWQLGVAIASVVLASCAQLRLGSEEGAPGESRAWVARGDALMQEHRQSAATGTLERAESAYREALRLDPTSPDALVGLAWVHGVEHEFTRSVELAERALARAPDHVRAHGVLGDAALELGDYRRAATEYQAMLDLRPDLAAYSRVAELFDRTGDPNRAMLFMRRAIDAGGSPEQRSWCRARLARMLWRRGALAAAEQELARALAGSDGNSEVLLVAGTLDAARGDYAGAIAHYETIVSRQEHPLALASLGDVYQLLGQSAAAERAYARAEAAFAHHGGNAVSGDLARARFLAERDGHLELAEQEALAAYHRHPTGAASDALAWVYHKQGRNVEADRLIHEALRKGVRDAEVLFHAGIIHASLGRRESARRHLFEAVSLNPTFHPIHAKRAFALLGEGAVPLEAP